MKSSNFAYLGAIDQLRGFAAVWIAVYHYYFLVSHNFVKGANFTAATPVKEYLFWTYNPLHSIVAAGHTAVSLFMVLSGFIFTYGAANRSLNYAGYLKNRIYRVYPLWVVLVIFGAFTTTSKVDLLTLIEALLPIGLHSAALPWTPFTAMHWSLVIEFQFYLIFPLLMAASQKVGMARLVLSIVLTMILLRLLATPFGADSFNVVYYTILGRIDQFLFGMLLAVTYAKGIPSRSFAKLALPVLIVVGVAIMMYVVKHELAMERGWFQSVRITLEGAFWASIIGCYLRLSDTVPAFIARIMEKIGEISFSIYMLHIAVIWIFCVTGTWIRLGMGVTADVVINLLVFLPVTLAVARLSFEAFERPFLALRVQYLKSSVESSKT